MHECNPTLLKIPSTILRSQTLLDVSAPDRYLGVEDGGKVWRGKDMSPLSTMTCSEWCPYQGAKTQFYFFRVSMQVSTGNQIELFRLMTLKL